MVRYYQYQSSMIHRSLSKSLRTLRSLRFFMSDNRRYGNNQDNRDVDSVFTNNDKIQKKMEEIKRRKTGTHQSVSDMMPQIPTFKLPPEIQQFRRETNTSHLLNFENIQLAPTDKFLLINSYSPDSIEVNNIPYPPSLILYNKQVFVWEVDRPKNLRPSHFNLIRLLQPKPQYVIIGIEDRNQLKFDFEELEWMREYGDVDVLPMFEAIGSFNLASEDQIKVILFIISE